MKTNNRAPALGVQRLYLNRQMKAYRSLVLLIALSVISFGEEKPVRLKAIAPNAKHPKGVNIELMSKDPEYGYSSKKPIRVQSNGPYGGPGNEISYFGSLLDAAGKPIRFRRLGSGGDEPEGHEEDLYEIETSAGEVVRLWICMYHPNHAPDDQPSPVGLYKKIGEKGGADHPAAAPESKPEPQPKSEPAPR